jgi:ribose-phosphate pyrophosphokinase
MLENSVLAEILVTDTMPIPITKAVPKLKRLTVAPLFAAAIARIHDGRSVSELFS